MEIDLSTLWQAVLLLEFCLDVTIGIQKRGIVSRIPYYNKEEAPSSVYPTEVRLGIYVNSFHSISEQQMDYSVSMYFRQSWKDQRLSSDKLRLDPELKHKVTVDIWVPDTFFRNEKRAQFHGVTVANKLLNVNGTGHVWYVRKITATLSCQMNLRKYPMDRQLCPILFESFGYTMDTMYFAWLNNPVDIDPKVTLPQFTLMDKILYDCSQNYTAGAFPCLEIRFVLQREIGFFLIQVYIPTILIVILSWVGFWINIDSVAARVNLGLLTVLAMTTSSTGAQSTLPKVSYIKAIDIWMITCLTFVFASLSEFAVVNVISRKEVRTIKPVKRSRRKDFDPETEQMEDKREPPKVVDPQAKQKALKIDKISRKLFPLLFLLFNVVYWTVYTVPTGSMFQ